MMHAISSEQIAQQKKDAKRCISVLLPSVPAPLVDYALNATVFASVANPGLNSSRGVESVPDKRFTIRRMNSGHFGEISITEPCSTKHLKNNTFGRPEKLDFSFKTGS